MKETDKEKAELQQDLEKLIETGKKKGFLTYDEVNDALSDGVDSSAVDHVFEVLDGKGIRVVDADDNTDETPGADGETPAAPAAEAEETREEQVRRLREENKEDDVYAEKFIPLDDPVKMYLKQMGSIPLLTRDEEISMAKRIEEAEKKFAEALFVNGYARKEAMAIIDKALKEEINVEDVVKDELERRPKLLSDLKRLLDKSRRTKAPDQAGQLVSEFRLTASVNDQIISRINAVIDGVAYCDRQLAMKKPPMPRKDIEEKRRNLIKELDEPIVKIREIGRAHV